jgi:hypothetical protein
VYDPQVLNFGYLSNVHRYTLHGDKEVRRPERLDLAYVILIYLERDIAGISDRYI